MTKGSKLKVAHNITGKREWIRQAYQQSQHQNHHSQSLVLVLRICDLLRQRRDRPSLQEEYQHHPIERHVTEQRRQPKKHDGGCCEAGRSLPNQMPFSSNFSLTPFIVLLDKKVNRIYITFLPHRAKAILPPSSSPAGMLFIALMRSPAHAHITTGFRDNGVPSLRTSPRRSLAMSKKVISLK